KVAAGSKVSLQVTSPSLAKPVQITLGTVSQEGDVTLDTLSDPPALPAGATLAVGTAFDITTTAKFDKATLCFEDPAITATTVLGHYENNKWNDTTTSITPPQICGDFTSFSPLAHLRFPTLDSLCAAYPNSFACRARAIPTTPPTSSPTQPPPSA